MSVQSAAIQDKGDESAFVKFSPQTFTLRQSKSLLAPGCHGP